MKAKVLIKRDDWILLQMEDGRRMKIPTKALNAGLAQGDTGTFWPDHQIQRMRFRIDATEVLPPEIPRDIITPLS